MHGRFDHCCGTVALVQACGFRDNQRLCFFRRLTEDKLQEIRQIFSPVRRLRRARHITVDQPGKRHRLPLGFQFMGNQLRQRATQRPTEQVVRAVGLLRANSLRVGLGHGQQ
ncbi:hypothetical protein D3C87_1765730 [compost metagenome]